MKGLAITSKGVEETASLEIKELINADCKISECCVVFEFNKFEDLCLLCYKAQSVDRIIYLIGSFEFREFPLEFEKFIEKKDFDEWIGKNKNFKVECVRIGKHEFKSVDAESKATGIILEKYKNNKIKFNIKGWDIIFFICIVDNKCYFGVDFAGFELNKRAYKIYLHPNSLRGTIAYALVRASKLKKKGIMMDAFSRDGIIPIEAAFYSNDFPVNYYKKDRFAFLKLDLGVDFEKFFRDIDRKIAKRPNSEIYAFDHLFKFVDFSRKNAKIAGVEKLLNFGRTELEWLDLKFKKESVDRIITNPPESKNANLDKIYNEFFYQGEYILKKNGSITIITRMPDFVKKHAERHNFVPASEKIVQSGEQPLNIILFKKKSI